MKTKQFTFVIAVFILALSVNLISTICIAQTHVSGSVAGTWKAANSPYIVDSFAFIEEDTHLIIEPGVEVRFAENKYIMIKRDGKMTAVGTRSRKITFTSDKNNPGQGDWQGIKIIDTDNGVKLKYCIIEYAQTGIYCEASVYGCDGAKNFTEIENCTINFCNYGISCEGEGHSISGCSSPRTGVCSPTIKNTFISNNKYDGIRLHAQSGYRSNGYCAAYISRNVIRDNGNDGIYCYGSSEYVEPDIINNTITYNSGAGISFSENFDQGDFKIINNIIAKNKTGIHSRYSKVPTMLYNDIWGNNNNYSNLSSQSTNISKDPLFFDVSSRDFHLKANSPCIDAGNPNSPKDPDGSRADIGAFVYDEGYISVDYCEAIRSSDRFFLSQNYPNPFNPKTNIRFRIQQAMKVEISVFDINGKIVAEILDSFMQHGSHSVIWDGSNFSSGTYIIQMKAGSFVENIKCALIK